ncbi:MAG: helix-turn-helix domain-containing protein [Desulfovibrionaceae bacterium]|nr:helix-turn-helix domain-containing protein [Desulfovibrionaceae bacterium]
MNRIKALRKEKGYTQIKMQMLTGIDQSDYSKIECDKRWMTLTSVNLSPLRWAQAWITLPG